MTIKAVIFDLDDTLYDEKQFVRSGHWAVASYMAKKYDVDKENFFQLLSSMFSKQGRTRVFDSTLETLNMYNEDVVLEMVKTYRNHNPNIALYKEAQKLLPEMKKQYSLGLITDGIPKVQKNKVQALKIQNLFHVITYSTMYGGKDDIAPFLITLRKLKVKPPESIYVDDNPCKGFAAAEKMRIHTVRIMRGPNKNITLSDDESKYEFEIKNLQQLFKVICTIEKEENSTETQLQKLKEIRKWGK